MLAALMVPGAANADKYAPPNYNEFAVTDIARERMFTESGKACQTAADDEPSLMMKCYSTSQNRLEKLLNSNYQKVMAGIPKDKRSKLRIKQRQWLASRDYACETASQLNTQSITYRSETHKCHLTETYRRALWLLAHDSSSKDGIG